MSDVLSPIMSILDTWGQIVSCVVPPTPHPHIVRSLFLAKISGVFLKRDPQNVRSFGCFSQWG